MLKNYTILTACLLSTILIISGVVMAFQGIESTGVIDIKTDIIFGKIRTGFLGLLFTFVGSFLLGIALLKRREMKITFKQKVGNDTFDWSRWETGDPYCDLMEHIFPNEKIPDQYKCRPVIDWMSKEAIEEMVDMYLINLLQKKALSFLKYHIQNDGKMLAKISDAVSQVLDQGLIDTPKQEKLLASKYDLRKNEVVMEMMYMLEYTVKWYFTSKKRIFAGWDKYPVCSPPIHQDLATWLDSIDLKWQNRVTSLKKYL